MELILDNTRFGKVRFGVKDIDQAIKTLNTYVNKTSLTSSEIDCDFGSVYADTNSDKKIAEISYNGQIIELTHREEREDLVIINGQIYFKDGVNINCEFKGIDSNGDVCVGFETGFAGGCKKCKYNKGE
jgi:hypothetical protein